MEYVLAAVVVALALAFVVWPLLWPSPAEVDAVPADASPEPSGRRREAIYREVLELEFDRRMGKLSASDYQQLSDAALARAAALIAEDEADKTALDDRLEREIAQARASLKRDETRRTVEQNAS